MVNPLQLYITDARPFAAAVGNKMAGAGSFFFLFPISHSPPPLSCFPFSPHFSLPFFLLLGYEEYSSCKLEFLDIPNIHAMRSSLAKLQAACESGSLSGAKMDDWLVGGRVGKGRKEGQYISNNLFQYK